MGHKPQKGPNNVLKSLKKDPIMSLKVSKTKCKQKKQIMALSQKLPKKSDESKSFLFVWYSGFGLVDRLEIKRINQEEKK